MSEIPSHFQLPFRPVAAPEAQLTVGLARFTLLTSRLIRMEFAENGRFQDAPTQLVWYRKQPLPDFSFSEHDGRLEIKTPYLQLNYQTGRPFSAETLSITLLADETTWHFGDDDAGNLRGTARTLDAISGSTPLGQGLFSRSGWTVIDDTHSLIFNDQGWLVPPKDDQGGCDLYFFGYGHDFQACLRDYSQITGPVPLLPRWALGNWWSRYNAYAQHELTKLMEEFRSHDIPLSVCMVDMDWHLTEVGEDDGWTGYTWNRELFPEPDAFIGWLHDLGLKTALNLHPASGIRPYEEQYGAMAKRLGIAPASGQTIEFNISDPEFARAYFELLHHPNEQIGVDFWWIDWQQGTDSKLPGLDPLWWLNHFHFYDIGRLPAAGQSENRRPIILSRWGGLGNHRYPIGFSGDTWVTWQSLAFQPYFTATAANVGYGWWSHDIGGHMFGLEESELFTRWLQFGAFSPILRLHSTNNPFHERRPWAFDAEIYQVTKEALQLRHALIPYLYTQSWLNHDLHLPPIRSMYVDYPDQEEAYVCPDQYLFGQDLIVAPFTAPADPETRRSRQLVWLPPGDWYHFFTGEYVAGGRWQVQYGTLSDIPVFARAGAIIPMGPKVGWGGVKVPVELDLHLFAGADGSFSLYEDDGESTAYRQGDYSLTEFKQVWRGNEVEITVAAATGNNKHIPDYRIVRLHVHGIRYPLYVAVMIEGTPVSCHLRYEAVSETVHLSGVNLPKESTLSVTIGIDDDSLLSRRDRFRETSYQILKTFRLETEAKLGLTAQLDELRTNPEILNTYLPVLSDSQARALIEISQQTGVHHIKDRFAPDLLLLWNNNDFERMHYQYHTFQPQRALAGERFQSEAGIVPSFRKFTPETTWQLTVDYAGITSLSLGKESRAKE